MSTEPETLFDVLAVNIETNIVDFVMSTKLTLRNAEAVEKFAVLRRGVEHQYYTHVPTGTVQQGQPLIETKVTS